jgi:hypothetical protein
VKIPVLPASNWQQRTQQFHVWALKRMLDRLKVLSNKALGGIDSS